MIFGHGVIDLGVLPEHFSKVDLLAHDRGYFLLGGDEEAVEVPHSAPT